MTGAVLREIREEKGWPRRVVGHLVKVNVSASLVADWEHGRRRITDGIRSSLARKVDDGQLYMALGREATGGPCMPPWLNGIDNHRIICVLKTIEELDEAIMALKNIMPILMHPPGKIGEGSKETIKATMLEIIESTTASENTCARLAREYAISLAELWDQHEQELIEKGYLHKENAACSAAE